MLSESEISAVIDRDVHKPGPKPSWSETDMVAAIQDYLSDKGSLRDLSKQYRVPKSTLSDYVRGVSNRRGQARTVDDQLLGQSKATSDRPSVSQIVDDLAGKIVDRLDQAELISEDLGRSRLPARREGSQAVPACPRRSRTSSDQTGLLRTVSTERFGRGLLIVGAVYGVKLIGSHLGWWEKIRDRLGSSRVQQQQAAPSLTEGVDVEAIEAAVRQKQHGRYADLNIK